MIRLYDIEWDVDGKSADLPAEVVLDPKTEEIDDISMEGADWLSDRYGWCVVSFRHEALVDPLRTLAAG